MDKYKVPKQWVLTLCLAFIGCMPLIADQEMAEEEEDYLDEKTCSFYLDDEDDIAEADGCAEPWHHHYSPTRLDLEDIEEEAWNLELDTAWPGQREDYSDNVIR